MIKIFDHIGYEVEMEYLKDVIKKYENGETFGLRIQLDKDEEMVDAHAVKTANVCFWRAYFDEKIINDCYIYPTAALSRN